MRTNNSSRGSIILSALIMTLITGTLVGLFLQTVAKELQHTHRYAMGLAAINLAEAGIENALHASLHTGWNDWTTVVVNGQTRRFRDSFDYLSLDTDSQSRSLKVYVQSESGIADIIIAEATISLSNNITVTRQVGIEVETNTQRFWVNAILGRDVLDFRGNKSILDSFSSADFDPVANPGTTILDYYNDLRDAAPSTILGHDFVNGNASIASLSVLIGSIDIGNADVYGGLATGAPQGSSINSMVGPQGSLYNEDSVYGTNIGGSDRIDEAFVSYEFYAELPIPETPIITGADTNDPGDTIGSVGTASAYEFTDFSVSNKSTKTINGDVDIVVLNDLDIDGTLVVDGTVRFVIANQMNIKGEVEIANEGSMEAFVGGDIDIGGNGLVNLNKPSDLILYQTADGSSPSIVKVFGDAFFSGAVYAPNSEIQVRGGAIVLGSLVGNSITFTGNVDFHYDEELSGTSSSWTEESAQIVGWRELYQPIDMDAVMDNGYNWD